MPIRHFNDGMEIVYEDLNKVGSSLQKEFYDGIINQLNQQVTNAFYESSFTTEFSAGTSVLIRKGAGFQFDTTQVSPEPKNRLVYLAEDRTYALPLPDVTYPRIDLLCVRSVVADDITETRNYKDEESSVISPESFVVQKDWAVEFIVTAGTAAASPTAPAAPAGYLVLAELYMSAATGLANQNAITDRRTLIPSGSNITIDSSLYQSAATKGFNTPLSTLLSDFDLLHDRPDTEYIMLEELAEHPANPAAGKRKVYVFDGVTYIRDSAGAFTPLGSGGGGGSSLSWTGVPGEAPLKDIEFANEVYFFEKGKLDALCAYLVVPESFISGRAISMKVGFYSPAAAGDFLVQAEVELFRTNLDALDTPAGTHVSTNGAVTNTVANRYRQITLDLTADHLGSQAVGTITPAAGNLLKILLRRGSHPEIASAADTDTETLRFIPGSVEVKFT